MEIAKANKFQDIIKFREVEILTKRIEKVLKRKLKKQKKLRGTITINLREKFIHPEVSVALEERYKEAGWKLKWVKCGIKKSKEGVKLFY